MFTLIRNANVYSPAPLGKQDILMCGTKIAAMDDILLVDGLPNCRVLDAKGATVTPGFVDGHVHLIGGGGEGGFATRTPEVNLTTLTTNGITTVAGLLGTDTVTRHLESLYAKACGLTAEGISAYMFTGGYKVPSPTITGEVDRDITLIDKVIGLKTAIADHRSSQPTCDELARLVSQSRVGGMLSGKAGSVVVHMGAGEDGMDLLRDIIAKYNLPISQFIPTHINRTPTLYKQAMAWAKDGGYADFSSGGSRITRTTGIGVKTSTGIAEALEDGVPLERLCVSTDGNGSMPRFDEEGNFVRIEVAGFEGLLDEVKDMVQQEGLPLETALRPVTQTPAEALGLSDHKGSLAVGQDADLLILDSALNIQQVFAKGQMMVDAGEPIVFGTFE